MTSPRDLLISDLEAEISQLQSEWAAVSEYCAEVNQQQQHIAQDIAAAELEEKLLNKKLRELLGEAEPEGHFLDEQQKAHDARGIESMKHPWRQLNAEEKARAEQLVFGDEIPSERQGDQVNRSVAANFVLQTTTACEGNSTIIIDTDAADAGANGTVTTDPAKLRVHSAEALNVASLINQLMVRAQEANSVAAVLQRQKEGLMARLHQGGAVSVALDAMLLYRQPVMAGGQCVAAEVCLEDGLDTI